MFTWCRLKSPNIGLQSVKTHCIHWTEYLLSIIWVTNLECESFWTTIYELFELINVHDKHISSSISENSSSRIFLEKCQLLVSFIHLSDTMRVERRKKIISWICFLLINFGTPCRISWSWITINLLFLYFKFS